MDSTQTKNKNKNKIGGPVPSGGLCRNQGSFQNGNHCVLMKGNALDEFVKVADPATYDDSWTGKHREWCVCLHDYLHMWGKGGGDIKSCSTAALAAN
jgi:hypothetical protein